MEYSPFSAAADGLPAPRPVGASPGNIAAIIVRTEEAVEDETRGIGRDPRFDVAASNLRKSRCLYELSRAVKGLQPADLGADARAGFARLREKLARNERAIKAHLEAVGEVAALLQSAIAAAQSDGTYGAGEFGWAR
jgi:hypothetical protein